MLTVLVVDAMTGQDAVNVAQTFAEKVGIDGVILTKMDGDTRGGAALSIKSVTGKPILYVGMGEKLVRSGTVLSGAYGIQNPWYGRCNEPDREKAEAAVDRGSSPERCPRS
ncbi:MAG: hypothetical protein ACLURP_14585 [Ruminococcus sp.]